MHEHYILTANVCYYYYFFSIVEIVYVGILGLAQGIRRIFVQLGLILGPLWAGSMFYQPYYMFSVMLAVNLLLMASVMLIFLIYYIIR